MKVFTDEFSSAYGRLKTMIETLEPVRIEEGSQGLKDRKALLERLIWEFFKSTDYRNVDIAGNGSRVNIAIYFAEDQPDLNFWVQFKGGSGDGDQCDK